MRLGAYTVEIVAGDSETPLDEYQVELKGNEITCWVASEEGQVFKVCIDRVPQDSPFDECARLFLDAAAESIEGRILPRSRTATTIPGRSISASELAPFQFNSIITTDEDTPDVSDVGDSFGSIKLTIHRGTKGARVDFVDPQRSTSEATFNELAVKKRKVTHVCGFVDAVPRENTRSSFTYHDPIERPLFDFVFKYRSRSLLQAMEIIQGSPAPPPPQNAVAGPSRHSGNSDIIEVSSGEDSDDEAVRALTVALAKAKKDARAAKAARRAGKTEPEDVKPKLERGDDGSVPRHAKKAKVEDEVIELSD